MLCFARIWEENALILQVSPVFAKKTRMDYGRSQIETLRGTFGLGLRAVTLFLLFVFPNKKKERDSYVYSRTPFHTQSMPCPFFTYDHRLLIV
jgi:hypothetical protein